MGVCTDPQWCIFSVTSSKQVIGCRASMTLLVYECTTGCYSIRSSSPQGGGKGEGESGKFHFLVIINILLLFGKHWPKINQTNIGYSFIGYSFIGILLITCYSAVQLGKAQCVNLQWLNADNYIIVYHLHSVWFWVLVLILFNN